MSSSTNIKVPKYLEDFSIGDVTKTGVITITKDMIVDFARQYDPQPMHLDDSAAKNTVFGGLVGSGWQTLAMTMRLVVDAGLLGSTPIVGAEFKETKFHAPLRPGDTIHVKTEIMDIHRSKSRPDIGFLDVKAMTLAEKDRLLITQIWRLVVPTRPKS